MAKLAIQSFQNDPTQPMSKTVLKNAQKATDIMPKDFMDDAESTDVSKAGDLTEKKQRPK